MATDTADLTTATPVEIDTKLAEIYGRLYVEWGVQSSLTNYIEDMEQGLAKREESPHLSGRYSCYTQESLNDLNDKMDASVTRSFEILAETAPYEAEFARRPWSRFHLVKNNGGHIHSSMSCSTCFPTTQFGWLPDLSGQTEAEAVAAHGAILCTICYPSAPSHWTDRHDDSVCEGSGQFYHSDKPSRTGYYSGNWGACIGCGENQTVSKAGKIRKHKKGN